MLIQYCKNCRHHLYNDNRVQCPVCYDLTIPASENLIGIVDRLINRGLGVVSATCDVHYAYDDNKGIIGKTVQIQIELNRLYPTKMFNEPQLPPDWCTYTYHTTSDSWIGPAYTGLGHVDSFLRAKDDDEAEFATRLTVANLEQWLDDRDVLGFYSVWRLFGALD